MKNLSNYTLWVGVLTIFSGILSLGCMWVGSMAVEYNFDAFSDPLLLLQYAHHHELAKWFNVLDLFGYYLLLLPLIFYYHQQYQYRTPWMPLFTFSGAAYVLTGAVGASILVAIWPKLMSDYVAHPESTAIITVMFETITLLVTKGLWNILEIIFATVWWIGLGRLIYTENKALGILTVMTGISTLLDATGTILGLPPISETGLNLYLLLGILWPIAIGIFLVKKARHAKTTPRQNFVSLQTI